MELDQIIESGFKSVQEKVGAELKASMEKYEGQLKETGTVANETKSAVQVLSEEFKSITASMNDLAQKQAIGAEKEKSADSAGVEFIKSEQFKQLLAGNLQRARLEVKNTVTTGPSNTFPQQNAGIIPGNFLPLTIRQILRTIPTSANMVNSLRELSWTNDAAEVSQGAAKPESDLTFEQYNVPIQTVAHWIKVSNQLLADAPAITAYIDTRLRDGLEQRIDLQLLKGNGTSPNLSGLTDSGNYTAYTATSDDNLVDAINRAKYALWATGNMPDTVIVNPADWGAMEIAKSTYGEYIYKTPGMAAPTNPFGLQVVLSNNMTAGNFLVGNLSQSAVIYARSGSVIEMGYINDDFTKNLVTIRAEERLGLGVDRPAGILYGAFSA